MTEKCKSGVYVIYTQTQLHTSQRLDKIQKQASRHPDITNKSGHDEEVNTITTEGLFFFNECSVKWTDNNNRCVKMFH